MQSHTEQDRSRTTMRSHAKYVLLIVLVALVPRVFVAARAVAPARDGIKYARAAMLFGQMPFREAITAMDIHPLYPLTLVATRSGVTAVTGIEGPYAWWYAGQVSSLVLSLFFLVLSYATGAQLWNARVSCFGCAAVSIAPRQVGYAVDLVSDNLVACLWMGSFALAVSWFRTPRVWKSACAGLLAGLAYLTHLSALLLPLVYCSALCFAQFRPQWRLRWRDWLSFVTAASTAWIVVVGPYIILIGGLTPRLAARAMLGITVVTAKDLSAPPLVHNNATTGTTNEARSRFESQTATDLPLQPVAMGNANPGTRLHLLPADGEDSAASGKNLHLIDHEYRGDEGYRKLGLFASLRRVTHELAEELRIWLLVLAGGAPFVRGRAKCALPAGLLVFFSLSGCAAMLLCLQMKGGYLAGRYALPIVPLIAMLGGSVVFSLIAWVQRTAERRRRPWLVALAWGLVVVVGAGICLPGIARRLHAKRFGHLEAAKWLVKYTAPDTLVFDATDFTAFFANRAAWKPSGDDDSLPPVQFAVVDPTRIYRTDHATFEATSQVLRKGRLVASFPVSADRREVGVQIYSMAIRSAGTPTSLSHR